jgi:hypothetical protein
MEGEVVPEPGASGLLTGETGILLVACRLGHPLEDDLRDRIRANLANEAEDLMWGAPGTLVAAVAMDWDDLARESADALAARRDADGLWTQPLGHELPQDRHRARARKQRAGAPQVEDPRNLALRTESGRTLARGQARGQARELGQRGSSSGARAGRESSRRARLPRRGAPARRCGARLASRRAGDEKVLICHGTSGNGFALLAAFDRTQDELWLDRARHFAMHALAQARRMPGRYSLFTGGAGTALFAAGCLEGDARYPVLERNRPAP